MQTGEAAATRDVDESAPLWELLEGRRTAAGGMIAPTPAHATNNNRMVFGGVLLGQAAAAANATAAGRPLHMLSANFHRGAALGPSVEYEVYGARDGGSFSTRRVTASQDGQVLAEFSASYQALEDGLDFDESWSAPPPTPESVATLAEATAGLERLPQATRRSFRRTRGLDVRPVDLDAIVSPGSNKTIRFWVRAAAPMPDRPHLWAPAIAYLSDFLMAGPGIAHHTFVHDPAFFGTTLNHTLWLHREADPSEWLLNEIHCHWTGAGRTINLGRLFTRDGRLVATNAQEALLRRRLPKTEGRAR
jgi:acyl-CoA thioesterase-2